MFQMATMPKQNFSSSMLVIFFDKKTIQKRKKEYALLTEEIARYVDPFLKMKDFAAEFDESAMIYPDENSAIERILLLGIGDRRQLSGDKLRQLGFTIKERQKKYKASQTHIYLGNLAHCDEHFIKGIVEGAFYQNYHFLRHKTVDVKKVWDGSLIFVHAKEEYISRFRKVQRNTEKIMQGVNTARNLANEPSNHLTPGILVERLKEKFQKFGNIQMNIYDSTYLIENGFNALLAVAKGSVEKPYLIEIIYTPPKKSAKSITLVGKGVTFDSGGISLKPSAGMEEMKFDMAGAATVAGVMESVALLKPAVQLTAYIPAVENMPGGKAFKPGDVFTAYNGKTVEMINTDAEGRLIMIDAMAFAEKKWNPDVLITIATLTGSVAAALGDKMAGLFTKDQSLMKLLQAAAEASGDRLWPLPLDDIYMKELESDYADIKNIGSRWGGALQAALFLNFFVDKCKFVHLDIAGIAYNVKHIPYLPKGATGYGVRLLTEALQQFEKKYRKFE
jgi:leucyl aminopeptidase